MIRLGCAALLGMALAGPAGAGQAPSRMLVIADGAVGAASDGPTGSAAAPAVSGHAVEQAGADSGKAQGSAAASVAQRQQQYQQQLRQLRQQFKRVDPGFGQTSQRVPSSNGGRGRRKPKAAGRAQ